MVRSIVCAIAAVVLAGCREGQSRLQGTWERTDNPGQIIRFEDGRMTHHYPHGGKPIAGPYDVVEDDGDRLVIEPIIEFADGRSLRADRQRIEFVDGDTLTMKNAKNGTGGTYERRS
jgi:hypothetical protein